MTGRRLLPAVATTLVALLLNACSSGSGGDGENAAQPPPPASTSVSTTPAEGAAAETEADLLAVFATYKDALLAGDAATALDAVSGGTVAYFTDMQALGARAGAEEIMARGTGDRFIVYLLQLLDAALPIAADSADMTEDEFIFDRVAATTGRPVPPDVWARPQP